MSISVYCRNSLKTYIITVHSDIFEMSYLLQTDRKSLSELAKHLIDDRKANPPRSEAQMTFLDRILSYTDDTDVQHADALEFTTAGQFCTEYGE